MAIHGYLQNSRRGRRQKRTKANRTFAVSFPEICRTDVGIYSNQLRAFEKEDEFTTRVVPIDGHLWIYAPVVFDEVEKPTSWTTAVAVRPAIILCIVTARIICVPYQRDARVTSSRRRRSSTMMLLQLLYIIV